MKFRYKKTFALATLLFFLASDFFSQFSYASSAPAGESKTSPKVLSRLSSLRIPVDLGKIQDSFQGSGKTVFLIQDAHAIPDAQRSIQKLIDYFEKQYGVDRVALEGAASKADAQIFKSFPDKALLKKVFDEYMERGELAGANAAAIFNESPALYQGVEDWKLYEEGLGLYLAAMEQEEGLLQKVFGLEKDLRAKKEKLYSRELLEIDRALEDFHVYHRNLGEVLKKLAAIKVPEKNSELALLIQEIQKAEARPSVDQRPEAIKLEQERLERMNEIEGTKLFRDFERYGQSVKESLFRNTGERALDGEGRQLELLAKLVKLELSREEWAEISQSSFGLLRNDISKQIAFYENAEKRDGAFLGNLLKFIGDKNSAILVAGGFHSQGLAERLRAKGISYVLIMPAMKALPEEIHYRSQMRGDVSWKNYFEVENGRVHLYKAFVRAVRDKLLASGDVLKTWRDQIVRDLAAKGEIEKAGDYTVFLDETVQKKSGGENREGLERVKNFIDGLRILESQGELTEANILKLLNPAAAAPVVIADVLAPGDRASAALVIPFAPSKSEMRGFYPVSLKPDANLAEIEQFLFEKIFKGLKNPKENIVVDGMRLDRQKGSNQLEHVPDASKVEWEKQIIFRPMQSSTTGELVLIQSHKGYPSYVWVEASARPGIISSIVAPGFPLGADNEKFMRNLFNWLKEQGFEWVDMDVFSPDGKFGFRLALQKWAKEGIIQLVTGKKGEKTPGESQAVRFSVSGNFTTGDDIDLSPAILPKQFKDAISAEDQRRDADRYLISLVNFDSKSEMRSLAESSWEEFLHAVSLAGIKLENLQFQLDLESVYDLSAQHAMEHRNDALAAKVGLLGKEIREIATTFNNRFTGFTAFRPWVQELVHKMIRLQNQTERLTNERFETLDLLFTRNLMPVRPLIISSLVAGFIVGIVVQLIFGTFGVSLVAGMAGLLAVFIAGIWQTARDFIKNSLPVPVRTPLERKIRYVANVSKGLALYFDQNEDAGMLAALRSIEPLAEKSKPSEEALEQMLERLAPYRETLLGLATERGGYPQLAEVLSDFTSLISSQIKSEVRKTPELALPPLAQLLEREVSLREKGKVLAEFAKVIGELFKRAVSTLAYEIRWYFVNQWPVPWLQWVLGIIPNKVFRGNAGPFFIVDIPENERARVRELLSQLNEKIYQELQSKNRSDLRRDELALLKFFTWRLSTILESPDAFFDIYGVRTKDWVSDQSQSASLLELSGADSWASDIQKQIASLKFVLKVPVTDEFKKEIREKQKRGIKPLDADYRMNTTHGIQIRLPYSYLRSFPKDQIVELVSSGGRWDPAQEAYETWKPVDDFVQQGGEIVLKGLAEQNPDALIAGLQALHSRLFNKSEVRGLSKEELREFLGDLFGWTKEDAGLTKGKYLYLGTDHHADIYSYDDGGFSIVVMTKNKNDESLELTINWIPGKRGLLLNSGHVMGFSDFNPLLGISFNRQQPQVIITLPEKLRSYFEAREIPLETAPGPGPGQAPMGWKIEFMDVEVPETVQVPAFAPSPESKEVQRLENEIDAQKQLIAQLDLLLQPMVGTADEGSESYRNLVQTKTETEQRILALEKELEKAKAAGPQIPSLSAELQSLQKKINRYDELLDEGEKLAGDALDTYDQTRLNHVSDEMAKLREEAVAEIKRGVNAGYFTLSQVSVLISSAKSSQTQRAFLEAVGFDIRSEMRAIDAELSSLLSEREQSLQNLAGDLRLDNPYGIEAVNRNLRQAAEALRDSMQLAQQMREAVEGEDFNQAVVLFNQMAAISRDRFLPPVQAIYQARYEKFAFNGWQQNQITSDYNQELEIASRLAAALTKALQKSKTAKREPVPESVSAPVIPKGFDLNFPNMADYSALVAQYLPKILDTLFNEGGLSQQPVSRSALEEILSFAVENAVFIGKEANPKGKMSVQGNWGNPDWMEIRIENESRLSLPEELLNQGKGFDQNAALFSVPESSRNTGAGIRGAGAPRILLALKNLITSPQERSATIQWTQEKLDSGWKVTFVLKVPKSEVRIFPFSKWFGALKKEQPQELKLKETVLRQSLDIPEKIWQGILIDRIPIPQQLTINQGDAAFYQWIGEEMLKSSPNLKESRAIDLASGWNKGPGVGLIRSGLAANGQVTLIDSMEEFPKNEKWEDEINGRAIQMQLRRGNIVDPEVIQDFQGAGVVVMNGTQWIHYLHLNGGNPVGQVIASIDKTFRPGGRLIIKTELTLPKYLTSSKGIPPISEEEIEDYFKKFQELGYKVQTAFRPVRFGPNGEPSAYKLIILAEKPAADSQNVYEEIAQVVMGKAPANMEIAKAVRSEIRQIGMEPFMERLLAASQTRVSTADQTSGKISRPEKVNAFNIHVAEVIGRIAKNLRIGVSVSKLDSKSRLDDLVKQLIEVQGSLEAVVLSGDIQNFDAKALRRAGVSVTTIRKLETSLKTMTDQKILPIILPDHEENFKSDLLRAVKINKGGIEDPVLEAGETFLQIAVALLAAELLKEEKFQRSRKDLQDEIARLLFEGNGNIVHIDEKGSFSIERAALQQFIAEYRATLLVGKAA